MVFYAHIIRQDTTESLQVHGSGYKEMTLISNAKAEKLNKRCVKIQQNSLDVDWFCHEMAQKLCAVAGKTYWYCNDYDVEVVDFDPVAGDVICVAVVLVTATYVTQKVVVPASASTSMPCQISSLQVVIIPQLCILWKPCLKLKGF